MDMINISFIHFPDAFEYAMPVSAENKERPEQNYILQLIYRKLFKNI